MEQSGYQCAHRNAQNGVGEGGEHGQESGGVLEGTHSGFHGTHADEKQPHTQQNLSHKALMTAVEEHVE